MERGEADREKDQEDNQGEEEFLEGFWFLGRSGHEFIHRENFRIGWVGREVGWSVRLSA